MKRVLLSTIVFCVAYNILIFCAFALSQIWNNEFASVVCGVAYGLLWGFFFDNILWPQVKQAGIVATVLLYSMIFIGLYGILSDLRSLLVTGDYCWLFGWFLPGMVVGLLVEFYWRKRRLAIKPPAEVCDNPFNVDEYHHLREQKDKLDAQRNEVDARLKELDAHPDKEKTLEFPRRF